MGMLVASFRVPYRGMPIIACYQFQAAKLRFFPETTKYFLLFLTLENTVNAFTTKKFVVTHDLFSSFL